MSNKLDLDVDAPDKVAGVLRSAADSYRESDSELESAWQDENAGSVWSEIAEILETAAETIEDIV